MDNSLTQALKTTKKCGPIINAFESKRCYIHQLGICNDEEANIGQSFALNGSLMHLYPSFWICSKCMDQYKEQFKEQIDMIDIIKKHILAHGDRLVDEREFEDIPIAVPRSNGSVSSGEAVGYKIHHGEQFEDNVYVCVKFGALHKSMSISAFRQIEENGPFLDKIVEIVKRNPFLD